MPPRGSTLALGELEYQNRPSSPGFLVQGVGVDRQIRIDNALVAFLEDLNRVTPSRDQGLGERKVAVCGRIGPAVDQHPCGVGQNLNPDACRVTRAAEGNHSLSTVSGFVRLRRRDRIATGHGKIISLKGIRNQGGKRQAG